MLGPAIALIRSRLEAETPIPAGDLAWYQEAFTRPEPPRPWALVRVVGGLDALATLASEGKARGTQAGLIQIFVHMPKGLGQQAGADIADAFTAVLRRRNLGDPLTGRLVTGDARIAADAEAAESTEVPKDADETYDVTFASVPFEFHYAR